MDSGARQDAQREGRITIAVEVERPKALEVPRWVLGGVLEDGERVGCESTRGVELVPVAQLDTKRNVTRLLDDNGDLLLEIADDRVKGTVLGDEPVIDRWREVEAELIKGDAALLKKAGKRLRKAGATPADASSKLARLLDSRLRAVQVSKPLEGTAGAVVVGYLASQVTALLAQG